MRNGLRIIRVVAVLAALVSASPAQDFGTSARDLFYARAAPPAKPPARNGRTKPAGIPAKDNHPPDPEGGSAITVSTTLGLRYAVLKQSETMRYLEVTPDAIFHAGDRIRLSVMSNQNGYLYIVQQGSSGTWSPLFPNAEINGGDNLIEARVKYEIPGSGNFLVDERAGEEKIFILLTRTPEPDLDRLVMALQKAGNSTPGETTAASPAAEKGDINNALIMQLRQQVRTRDLVFSRTDTAGNNEKAVYVVNAASSDRPDSRVVVDLKLNHR